MDDPDWLAERFEPHRPHLRAVAYHMLGSGGESDDAVQEAWLRLSRTDPAGLGNLGGWLTSVVARVCLDLPRARRAPGLRAPRPVRRPLRRGRGHPGPLSGGGPAAGQPGPPPGTATSRSSWLAFSFRGGRILELEVISDPGRLAALDLVPVDG
jgi:hypothetical protein